MSSLRSLLALCCYVCVEGLSLYKVIAVSRHSVRVGKVQDGISRDGRNWFMNYEQDWGAQGPMNLTKHGKQAAQERGKWWKQLYVDTGLLKGTSDLTVYADGHDVTNREKVTAEGFLSGFLPTKEVNIHLDPDFSEYMFAHGASRNASDYRCGAPGKATVDATMGGSVDRMHSGIDPVLEKVNTQFDCCSDSICQQYGGMDTPCTLTNIPEVWNDYFGFYMGSWLTGLMSTDYILMMYANNMSWDQVARGTDNFGDYLRDVTLPLGVVYSDYASGYQYSRAYGSQFLRHIGDTMMQIVYGQETYGLDSNAADDMVLYFAHGENIGYLATLLKLEWIFEQWGPSFVPPVGMLVFEVLKEGEMYYVKTYAEAQHPEQLRNLEELTPESPPDRVFVSIPECVHGPESSCPVKDFVAIIYETILDTCTKPYKEGGPTAFPAPAVPTPAPTEASDDCSSKTGLIVAVVILAVLVCVQLGIIYYYYRKPVARLENEVEYMDGINK
eukprot:TRINITY_DN33568_c0_g1_i1.p1 TRINITY_DN33568_c0_g1~~TRINITY_DN33568_c0_g1_i1.p1  ORF type:complete len:499 (+),score=80.79 TRINITY_DN33568_c0_g1_i1:50-1546(+)